jgi:molecular chaperone GrpE
VADDLERALANRPDGAEANAWSEGVQLVVRRIREYLRRQGIDVVDPLGEPFDPAFHEAVLEVDGEERVAPGAVAEVVVKGYRRGDRALRPARVVVARQAAAHPNEGGTESSRD